MPPIPKPTSLPPPPFWRTPYFANSVLARRPWLDPIDIQQVLDRPTTKRRLENGRYLLSRYVDRLQDVLFVVLDDDGISVHTAYLDE